MKRVIIAISARTQKCLTPLRHSFIGFMDLQKKK